MALFELDNPFQHFTTETLYVDLIKYSREILEKRSFLTVENFRAMEESTRNAHTQVCLYLGELYRRGLYTDDASLRTIFDTTSISCLVCKDVGERTNMTDFQLHGVCPVYFNRPEGCVVVCEKCESLFVGMRPMTDDRRIRLLAGKYDAMLKTLWKLYPAWQTKLEMIQFVKKDMTTRIS
jgi:hypothetical protein